MPSPRAGLERKSFVESLSDVVVALTSEREVETSVKTMFSEIMLLLLTTGIVSCVIESMEVFQHAIEVLVNVVVPVAIESRWGYMLQSSRCSANENSTGPL